MNPAPIAIYRKVLDTTITTRSVISEAHGIVQVRERRTASHFTHDGQRASGRVSFKRFGLPVASFRAWAKDAELIRGCVVL